MKAATSISRKETSPGILDHLTTVGLLARHPWIGVTMFVVGMLLFGGLALNLRTQGPLYQEDLRTADALYATAMRSPAFLIQAAIFGSFLGREMVVMIALALGLYFFYKRFWGELVMVILGFEGSEILFRLLSGYFNRHRPVFPTPVWEVLAGPGFPSGHAMSAIVCYGFLAYLLVPKMPSRFWKAFVMVITLLIMIAIGLGRLYIGDHYLTDVMAGYAMGIAWAGLIYTTLEWIWEKKNKFEQN